MAPKIIFETTSPSDPPPLSLKHPASSPLKRVKGKRVKPSSGDPEDIFSDMAEEQATQEAIFGIVDPQDNATPQMTNRADNGATEPDQIAAAGDKQSLANALPAPRETHPVVPHSIHDSPNHSTVSDPDPPSSTMDTEPHAPAPVSLPDSPHLGSTPHLLPGTPQIAPPPADFDITMKGIPTPPPAPIIAAVPANSDGLMAIPPGGFPPSEQVDFSSLALALYPTRFKQFNERATETDCVTFVLNGRFDLEGEQAAAIEEHIRHITGNPNAEVLAGFPPTQRLPGGPAFPHMIRGISPEQKQMLIARSIWNSSTLAYRVLDWNPTPTWFAVTLGQINLEPGRHEERVAAEVSSFFASYTQLKDYIEKHHDNLTLPHGEPATTDAYIRELCHSVVAKGIKIPEQGRSKNYFNIHVRPPSVTRKGYRNWLSLLQSTTYFLDKNVAKPLNPGFICVICKGRDHPQEICPFPSFPGWPVVHKFAPGHKAKTNPDDSSDDDGNPFLGNAGRGRGRGRGNGRGRGRGLFQSGTRGRGVA
ncbi:hypothetical protein M422DRAFT_23438 [Sphaerobolus stellatus SS14]|nr:hypothetical protein M422DRAFT_23438 [Sphaerobolus stellatus SS14]